MSECVRCKVKACSNCDPFYNVGFTGGRTYSDAGKVSGVLLGLQVTATRLNKVLRVHVGDASGLDALVRAACRCGDIRFVEHVADWGRYGRSAGPKRNSVIVSNICRLIVFPGGAGTADCERQARAAGVRVERAL